MTEARAAAWVGNTDLAERSRASRKRFYAEHPDRREEARRRMREFLSRPENRTFVEADRRAKPVRCVETGEVYRSQRAAEKATGFCGIHKVCRGRQRPAADITGAVRTPWTNDCLPVFSVSGCQARVPSSKTGSRSLAVFKRRGWSKCFWCGKAARKGSASFRSERCFRATICFVLKYRLILFTNKTI